MTNTNVQTSDIVLASSLITNGLKMDGVSTNSIGHGTFTFRDVPNVMLLTYEAGGLRVEPKAFNRTLVYLSRLCRSKSRQ